MKLTKRDFALLGIIVYFTFIGGTFYSQLNFLLRVFNQIIVTLLLGGWLIYRLRKKGGLPHTYLDLGLALYLLANFLGAVLGQSPRFSLESIWYSVVHVLAFYLLVDLMRRGWTAKLTWAFYMAAAVVCLVGLAEFLAWYFGTSLLSSFSQGWLEIGGWRQPIPPRLYRLNIALNGSTPLAAYLALLTPPAIGLIMTLPRKNENRQALILWLILAFVVQILAFSRAGVLALGVSLSLFFIAWLNITGHGWTDLRSIWSRLRPLYRAVIIAGIVIILGLGLLWLSKSFSGRSGSTQFRITLWRAALTIFADNPLTGAGPGNFGRAMLGLNDASFPRRQFSTAHNIYLNTAAELGLMGLFVGGYLMLKLVLAGWRRWRQLTRPADRIRLAACGAALAGLAVQTLVDTYMATPNMLIMLALIAYIVGDVRESPQTMRRPYPAYAALGILLAYAAGFSWLAVADLHFQRSFNHENRGDLTEAIGEVVRARELDPHLALRSFRLALLEARLAAQTGDEGRLQAAIEHYQAGLQQEPIWGLNSANLAGLLWQQSKRVSAINMMQRSVAAADNPLYLINLGYFHEQDGDWAQASAAYGRALSISPRLAASGFWQATPLRIERWPDIVEAAAEYRLTKVEGADLSQRLLLTEIARAQDDFDTVATLVSPDLVASDARFQPALAELHLEQQRPDLAATVLDPPDKSPQEYLLWGRINMQQGDDLAAEKMFKTAIFLGDQSANYYLGQLYEQQGDLQAAERAYRRGFSPHLISENVPVIIFGRFGANDLVPQLLRIGTGSGQAKSWLALARLYEKQQRFAEAKSVYELLLAEDPYLMIAQERLDLVAEKLTP